ncbi:MAG TPA: glycosyltransferase family A protein [Pyrinomonadaceae bacterium]
MRQRPEIHSDAAPAVSVIIPAYNAATYIGEALRSVCEQTFTSREVIVINDGSPDTDEFERELEPFAACIQYVKQENLGAATARNAGLRAARGEFVAFLDADDTWLPNFLEEQIKFLKSTQADFVYSDALLVGESLLNGRTFMQVQPSRGAVTPESLLGVDVTILTSAVLARKAPILEVGLFDEELRRGHDFELWLRLAKRGVRFAYQRKVLVQHRILESGLSGDTISQLQRTLSVLERIRNREDLSATEEAALERNMKRTRAELALEDGKDRLLRRDFDGAFDCFKRAKHFQGSWKLRFICAGMLLAPELLRRMYQARVSRRRPAVI